MKINKSIIELVKPKHKVVCDKTLETVELWLDGKATVEECKVTADAAYAAYTVAVAYAAYAVAAATADAADAAANAAAAAWYAAYAAAYATNAAYYAANAAAAAAAAAWYAVAYANVDKQAIVEAQWAYYKELLAFETIIEDVLLA